VAPDLPREFNAFFTRALSHERDKRFQSAKDMAAALAYLSDCSMPSMRLPDPAVAMFNDLMIEDAPISTIDTGAIRRRIAMPDLPHDTMSSLTDSSIGGRINSETPVPRSGSLPGLQIDSRPPPRPKQRKLYLFAAIALLGLAGYLGHGALRYGVLNQQPVAAPATPVVEEPPPTSAHGQLPTSAASVPAPLASASAAPASAETAPDAGVKPLAPRRARPVIGAHPPKPPPPPATTATKAADPFSERL
jgi:hypothetical protein